MFEFYAPQGGSTCFPRLKTGEPVEGFCERLLEDSGVLLMPANHFDSLTHTQAAHFRIGLGRKDFEECLKHFEAFLQKQ